VGEEKVLGVVLKNGRKGGKTAFFFQKCLTLEKNLHSNLGGAGRGFRRKAYIDLGEEKWEGSFHLGRPGRMSRGRKNFFIREFFLYLKTTRKECKKEKRMRGKNDLTAPEKETDQRKLERGGLTGNVACGWGKELGKRGRGESSF